MSPLVVTTEAAEALLVLNSSAEEATIAVDSKNVIAFFIFKSPILNDFIFSVMII